MISIVDALGNISIAFGFPDEGILCTLQGWFIGFFLRQSWFYTLILSYQLYCLTMYGKLTLTKYQLHTISWSVNVFLELVILSTNTYGNDDEAYERIACLIRFGNNVTMGRVWLMSVYACPLFLCCSLMTFFSLRITYRYHYALSLQEFPAIRSAIFVLVYYPWVLYI